LGKSQKEANQLRVMLLELDGGMARQVLRGATDLSTTTVCSLNEALSAAADVEPQVLVVAFSDVEAQEVKAIGELTRSRADMPVLVISRPAPTERAVDVIKAGASGYLFTKDAEQLPSSVRELARGGVPMSDTISRLVLQRARRSSAKMAAVRVPSPDASQILSERQREILRLLQGGHSYEDIGTALGVSVNTVRSHLRTIYDRLGVTTKVEAVMVGIELGILGRMPTERPEPRA
jgi:DNA-binding NarL/FixJ family response regulator